jgi:hypothetical protein
MTQLTEHAFPPVAVYACRRLPIRPGKTTLFCEAPQAKSGAGTLLGQLAGSTERCGGAASQRVGGSEEMANLVDTTGLAAAKAGY